MSNNITSKCGYAAIIGRPNVGKSTLLNRILEQKISITSRKPQTTRQQILGIKTESAIQTIYIDTPGMHLKQHRQLNRSMNRAANSVLNSVNVLVFLIDAMVWKKEDEAVLEKLKTVDCPVILAINKVDKIKAKDQLLPFIEEQIKRFKYVDVIPLSAKNGKNVAELEAKIAEFLPESEHEFSEEEITDRTTKFLVAEIIREKLIRNTGEELPYSTAIEIEKYKTERTTLHISALILVEKPGQKAIVIGAKGERLKLIGQQARLDIEALVDQKVFLQLWVKVKENWADDERALKSLGY